MTVLKNKSVFYLIQNIHEKSKKTHQETAAANQRWPIDQKMSGPLPM
jgi:hypothetical protein